MKKPIKNHITNKEIFVALFVIFNLILFIKILGWLLGIILFFILILLPYKK
jgi:hypothetical protein